MDPFYPEEDDWRTKAQGCAYELVTVGFAIAVTTALVLGIGALGFWLAPYLF